MVYGKRTVQRGAACSRGEVSGKKFLLQGLTASTHLDALKLLFARPELERVILSVAFVTEAGVDLIASQLAEVGDRVDAFVGIRNDITSREGLLALINAGVNVHYVDTGVKNLLFHPKIYLVRCKTQAGAMIGSANLTLGGLNNNIESSVVLDLDLTVDEDFEFAESIIGKFNGLTVTHPRHVVRIQSAAAVDVLQAAGRLVDEASSSPPKAAVGSPPTGADDLPPIVLKVPRLWTQVKGSQGGKGQKPQSPVATPAVVGANAVVGLSLELLWKSKALTERDLGVPSGENTHATGSINLDKGLLAEAIDHRHYFRDDVFDALDWKLRSPTVDEAHATFGLVIKGVSRGEFKLRVGHTISTTSRSYLQRNAMTRLSWGPMKSFVARKELIGRTMSLHRDKADPTRFVVEID